jgi:hypothetical protein
MECDILGVGDGFLGGEGVGAGADWRWWIVEFRLEMSFRRRFIRLYRYFSSRRRV